MEDSKQKTIVIVGAGPSGLAMSACLNHLSIPHIIFEREDCFASLWQKKTYDRLKLHLPKSSCELPHMPFPNSYPKYVPKKEFITYLDDYVTKFKITPRYNTSVESAEHVDKKWNIKTRDINTGVLEEHSCDILIVASGETSDVFVPKVGQETFVGDVIHSTQYKSGQVYSGKNVLVVGSGNSGMEIALDLANHGAKTSIAIRSDAHILSREILNISVYLFNYISLYWVDWIAVMLSRLKFGDLSKYEMKRPTEGPFLSKIKYGKYPILDMGTIDKIKSGQIQVLREMVDIKGNEVLFNNGKSYLFDVIIFATGFRPSTSKWLKVNTDNGLSELGIPSHWKGENGIYYVGLFGWGFNGASRDAKNIANDIKAILNKSLV